MARSTDRCTHAHTHTQVNIFHLWESFGFIDVAEIETCVCVCAHSHPLSLDNLDVVLRSGVVSFRTQSSPEVTPQFAVFGQHRSYNRPDRETQKPINIKQKKRT